jgi:hypothetical protein
MRCGYLTGQHPEEASLLMLAEFSAMHACSGCPKRNSNPVRRQTRIESVEKNFHAAVGAALHQTGMTATTTTAA